jgi:hypothetical protein
MVGVRSKVISRLKGGETLIHVLPKGDSETETPFQYLSGGGRVTATTYSKLKPNLRPVSSGLFPSAEPQEWEWANG